MANYINEQSILGLMNKNAFINNDSECLSFYKTKNKKKVVFFSRQPKEVEEQYDQIYYMYLDEKPEEEKSAYKLTQVISEFKIPFFTLLSNSRNKEIYQAYRKYRFNQKVIDKDYEDCKDLISLEMINEMIEKWRYSNKGGMKYGWQEHAGIDKAWFQRFFKMTEEEKSKYQVTFFFYNKTLMGYSVIEKEPSNDKEFKYLIRKYILESSDNAGWRNICLYIDFITFKKIYDRMPLKYTFRVNWGASSGGTLWYKEHKWPIYELSDKWFYKVDNTKE